MSETRARCEKADNSEWWLVRLARNHIIAKCAEESDAKRIVDALNRQCPATAEQVMALAFGAKLLSRLYDAGVIGAANLSVAEESWLVSALAAAKELDYEALREATGCELEEGPEGVAY